ncbi:hypothetical protein B7494_g3110 [Chlorociboria aeruginascens]|nr:hypothetical protein B7494_g3110 [Chlorociboria aeruginascens]
MGPPIGLLADYRTSHVQFLHKFDLIFQSASPSFGRQYPYQASSFAQEVEQPRRCSHLESFTPIEISDDADSEVIRLQAQFAQSKERDAYCKLAHGAIVIANRIYYTFVVVTEAASTLQECLLKGTSTVMDLNDKSRDGSSAHKATFDCYWSG